MARTLYQVLGAHPRASDTELLAAWQRLADPLEREAKISGHALERLNEINAAWAVLGNPAARAAYDATLPESVFVAPPLGDAANDIEVPAGRPLFDWRVGRLLVIIAVLSTLAICWRSCSFSMSSDRARANAEQFEAEARAREAEARARDAENRARIDAQMNGSDGGLPAGEARWQREQDARANEEARRESDAQIAAREAAREREAAEAADLRARAEAQRERAEEEAAAQAEENRARLEREKAMLERLQDDNNRAMRLR